MRIVRVIRMSVGSVQKLRIHSFVVVVISPSVVKSGRRLHEKSRKIPYCAILSEVEKLIRNPYPEPDRHQS